MEVVIGIVALLIGGGLGAAIALAIKKKKDETKGNAILAEAKKESDRLFNEKELKAKERFLNLKEKHDKSEAERNKKQLDLDHKLSQRETKLSERHEDLKRKQRQADKLQMIYEKKLDRISAKEKEVDALRNDHIQQLEGIAELSKEEAKEMMLNNLKAEAQTLAMAYKQDLLEESKINANIEARKVVIQTIQRVAVEQTVDNAITVFNIEDDNIKGRIIGREGRNIKALEAATGVQVVVDDTPEAIMLSCFDPVRREIARLALHKLVTDGRIHPQRIEEVVEKTRLQMEEELIETGKRTVIDLGIHGLNPQLIRIIGRMKYRSSYGQNLLQHSREVANLCAIMASELKLNPKQAKRAGLLHDIGKVCEDNEEKPHAILGMEMAKKFGESAAICNAIGAHHDEIEMTNLISPIVQICDSISGARPGARSEIVESYIKRIKALEHIAGSMPGVLKAYAIQAGRELRVVVASEKVSDKQAEELSQNISQQIEQDITYPGQVKVMVIRETRSVAIAR